MLPHRLNCINTDLKSFQNQILPRQLCKDGVHQSPFQLDLLQKLDFNITVMEYIIYYIYVAGKPVEIF